MSTNLAEASASKDNPCFGSDPNVASLQVFTDDERNYLLPYAQLLYTESGSNPALAQNPDAPTERMMIRFAVAEVTVLGSGLKAIARMIQKCELKFVKSANRRVAAALNAHIAAISITFTKEIV